MPDEFRYIIFSKPELIAALQNHLRRRRQPLTGGSVESLEINNDLACRLTIKGGASRTYNQYYFRPSDVLEALVLSCREQRIPIPATRLQKSLHLLEDRLALVFANEGAAGRCRMNVLNHIYHHQLRQLE